MTAKIVLSVLILECLVLGGADVLGLEQLRKGAADRLHDRRVSQGRRSRAAGRRGDRRRVRVPVIGVLAA